MKIVLVAEAWGKSEAQFQHPLVGASGRELTLQLGFSKIAPFVELRCRKCKKSIEFTGLGFCPHCKQYAWPSEFDLLDHWKKLRADFGIAVTNVFNCRPPDNNIQFFFSGEKQTDLPTFRIPKIVGGHLKSEHLHHIKRLWKEIEDLNPNLIIALGNTPCWALLNQTKITGLRGTVNWSQRLNKKVLPTFHPAAVLRQISLRPIAIADFQKAVREAEFPEIRRPKRFITIPSPNEQGLEEIAEWLARPALAYAVDIETLRKQISIIGFSRSIDDSLVIPFRDANIYNGKIVDIGKIAESIGFSANGINFWPTAELEFKAWKLTIKGLESLVRKIFQNGIYDMSYFIKMGIHPKSARDDTMLWHHSRYPELQKSLGFLGSIYANDIAWKSMARHESLKRDE